MAVENPLRSIRIEVSLSNKVRMEKSFVTVADGETIDLFNNF